MNNNNDDNIKTIYQKNQKIKFKKSLKDEAKSSKNQEGEDVQVNFLLTPSKVPSSFLNKVELNDSRISVAKDDTQISRNCMNTPTQILIKRDSLSEMNISESNDEHESREFCLLMEHFFRASSDIERPPKWNFQEYHVAIEYDNNVLQEYNGILALDRLPTESYEKLKLIPKYDTPKDMNITLTDCSIKLKSWEEIRIRSKFLVKETALLEGIFHEKKTQGFMKVLDAETQYAIQEIGANAAEKPEKLNLSVEKYFVGHLSKSSSTEQKPFKINALHSELHNKKFDDELRSELHNKLEQELRDELQQELRGALQQELDREEKSSLKMKYDPDDLMNRKIRPLNRDCRKIWDDPIIHVNDLILKDSENKVKNVENKIEKCEVEKFYINESIAMSKDSKRKKESIIKLTKQRSLNSNKPSFFVYDRVERDLISGKKIFVGSFRNREGKY